MVHFDIVKLKETLSELESQTTTQEFWEDSKNSSTILKQINSLKSKIESYAKVESQINSVIEMSELLKVEPDEEMAKEVLKATFPIEKELEKLEITTLLSGKYDSNNAILTIHPGAGRNRGTRLGRNAVSYVY